MCGHLLTFPDLILNTQILKLFIPSDGVFKLFYRRETFNGCYWTISTDAPIQPHAVLKLLKILPGSVFTEKWRLFRLISAIFIHPVIF